MSTNPHDGAYPASARKLENYMDEGGYGRVRTITVQGGGLTKREYFAGLAMQGQITNAEILVRYGLYAADVARAAVEQADALIAALNKESQS